MHTRAFIAAGLLARWRFVRAVPTWPAPTDELEDILFLNTGYRSTGFASAVTPCSKGLQPRRVTAAEWLRTAFHDSISGNIYTGVGGLDGSIAWELDTLENEGTFADDSVAAWAPYVSDLTSLSDVIAAATYALSRSCSNISVAVRGGRIDATEAGPVGFVPQPQNAVGIFRNQFARLGLDDKGMVQLVACGHSIGGVHGADHPEITNQDLANFDTTPAVLDNKIAVEYVSGTTIDPLVVGQSTTNARNSDFKVFSQTDGNATIKSLAADPQLFASACQSVFQRMIDLVPAGTQLSDPITPYDVKPYALQLSLLDGGSIISFTGEVRVRTTQRSVSEVQLIYSDRNGVVMQSPINTAPKGTATGFDDGFSFFGFSADLPVDTSISSFEVSVTYNDTTQTIFDNNKSGFQVEDTVIYQAPQSCLDSSGKLTVVAAVRNQTAPNLQLMIKIPQASPNPVPSISTTTVPMATQSVVGPYQLYSANVGVLSSIANPPVLRVLAGNVVDTRKTVSGLPTTCITLAIPGQSTPISSSVSTQPSVSSFSFPTILTTPTLISISTTSSSVESGFGFSTSLSTSFPSSPTSLANALYQGCYYDAINPRALSAKSSYDDNMTVDECASTCMQYQYFGLEYSRECYCGNTLDSTSTQQSVTECNVHCGGNSAQICGGSSRISVYTNLQYSRPVNPQIAGYDYKGCYSESSSTRALLGTSFSNASMTVASCASLCKGSTYFGVEYSQECYCGNILQADSAPQSASDCDMVCSGNSTEYCGGSNRLNLYFNSTAPISPVVNPTITNYTYAGCYTDNVNMRVLSDVWTSDNGMTVEKCAATCEGHEWFGTEYAAECYCGSALRNTTEKVAEDDCGMTCAGNGSEFCGSGNRLSLYQKSG